MRWHRIRHHAEWLRGGRYVRCPAREPRQAVGKLLRGIALHRQPVFECEREPDFQVLRLSGTKLRFQKLLDRLRIRGRSGELQRERTPVAGFVAAGEADLLARPGHRADRAEQPECIACLEHADRQQPYLLHTLRTRFLPELHQRVPEHPLGSNRRRQPEAAILLP